MNVLREVNKDTKFIIGSPLVAWKCDRGEGLSWLSYAKEIKSEYPNSIFFAALELDSRGTDPFKEVIEIIESVGGEWWTYTLDDKQKQVTSGNRWIRIETGRNLIREYAQRFVHMKDHPQPEDLPSVRSGNIDAILYVDSDMIVECEHIAALMEIDHPVVGLDVQAYCLTGEDISQDPPIQEHWNTAGCLWVNSPAFYDMLWHHNALLNLSDDPATQLLMARTESTEGEKWGQTWVRKDVHMVHDVEFLVGVEERDIPDRDL